MDSPIMSLVVAFIAVAIMLSVGVTILGNVDSGFDCSNMSGNSTDGWQATCLSVQDQTQQSFSLLIVMLVVIAAIAILIVVRML